MANDSNTPLTQLPNNTTADSDLVNKILNQLDETATDVPTIEEVVETPSKVHINQPENHTTNECVFKEYKKPQIQKCQKFNYDNRPMVSDMPTPNSVKSFLSIFDTPEFYRKLKISLICVLLFFTFVIFSGTFVVWFKKLPIETINSLTGNLNNTGLLLQSTCFGAIHLFLSIFFDTT
tara:strand:- start:872 stop:1405 length:534 start_codon:yes stop_codon:yes gene_type:complete